MPKTLLIAGHGFLGAALEPVFIKAGWHVAKVNRSGNGGGQRIEISQKDSVRKLSHTHAPDLVIQCASTGGGGADAYRDVYLTASRNLREVFPNAQQIFVSSTSVYAQKSHEQVTEQSPAEPTTETGKILRQTEDEVLAAGGIVARLSGLYGEGRCHFLKQFLAGESRLDGAGDRIINFTHRHDAARALLVLAETPNSSIYNITATPTTQLSCFQQLAAHYKLPLPPAAEQKTVRKRGNSSKAVSNQKMLDQGWVPEHQDFLALCQASNPQ